jgi:hypothetical protein
MTTKTLAIAACCSLLGACATMIGPADAFRLTSPGMSDGQMMAPKMAGNFKKNPNCTGDNISPALEWSHAPAKTRSFALIVVDQAGRNGLGVSHGVVYGIPANVTSLREGALAGTPTVGVGGSNSLNMPYVGPCTPRNTAPHHYVYTLIATDLEPGALPAGLKQDDLLKSLNGHALEAASLALRFAQ